MSEHLPLLAKQMKRLAVIRSMSTAKATTGRDLPPAQGTGYVQQGAPASTTRRSVRHWRARTGNPAADLPGFISIAAGAGRNNGAGFRAASMPADGRPGVRIGSRRPKPLKVQDVSPGVRKAQAEARVGLLDALDRDFLAVRHPDPGPLQPSGRIRGQAVWAWMKPAAARRSTFDEEPDRLQGRLRPQPVRAGLPARPAACIERFDRAVHRGGALGELGHARPQNFDAVRNGLVQHCSTPPGPALMDRPVEQAADLLTTTLKSSADGRIRPHPADQRSDQSRPLPGRLTTVLGGGGVKGGQIVGRTSKDGTAVEDRPPAVVPDFMATLVSSRYSGADPAPSRTSPTSAAPSASPTPEPNWSRRSWRETDARGPGLAGAQHAAGPAPSRSPA